MPKIIKYLLITVLALLVLLGALLAYVAATFDPNVYKPQLIQLVKEKTQRTLAIPGEIKLTFFPRVGADLGQISLTEPRSEQVFASARQVQVSVALLPLLSRQVEADRVLIDGLSIQLQRDRQGRFNFDDLLPKVQAAPTTGEKAGPDSATHASPLLLKLGGLAITQARLAYRDDATQQKLEIHDLNLNTGALADGSKSAFELSAAIKGDKPRLDLQLRLSGAFTPELALTRLRLDDVNLSLNGAAADISDLQLKLALPTLEASPQAFTARALALDAAASQAGRKLSTRLSGDLQGDLSAQRYELTELKLELTAPKPSGGNMSLKAQGKLSADLLKETARIAVVGLLDSTRLDIKAGLRRFANPALDFDIALGDLDADQYLPAPAQSAPASGASSGASQETRIDLSALRALEARGTLTLTSLKLAGIKATQIRLQLRAADGRAEINPLSAALYEGKLAGALAASVGKAQRLSAKLDLQGINIGPLMKDALDKNPIEGRGQLAMDLSTGGTTVTQFKKGLNGTANVVLKDGAINGINLAAALRSAKAKLGGGSQTGGAGGQEKTDFTDLSASFKIRDGVAHNNDLSAKTPLLRLGGEGDIFIGEDRLDYTVKATVVPTLEGQGGPEIQQIKGLTIPVKLSGPYTAIAWKIDLNALAGNRARELVDQRKTQLRDDAQKKLDEEKAKLQERLKGQAEDKLKDLLRR